MAQDHLQQRFITAKAKRMVDRLDTYYKLGRRANQPTEKESAEELAANNGMSRDQMRKVRAFARSYSPQQFRALCLLRRPNGLPLHWGYVIALLAIEDPLKRIEMQEAAAAQGWSLADLQVRVRKLYGKARRKGGRDRLLPKTPGAALRLLKTYSQYAVVLCESLESKWLKERKPSVPASLQEDWAMATQALIRAGKKAGEWQRRFPRVAKPTSASSRAGNSKARG